MTGLAEELQTPLFGYLAELDEQLPGVVTGLYVVGSVALGDYQARTSNIDVVAVSDEPWSDAALRSAVSAQRGLHRHRGALVAYVATADLAGDPRGLLRPCFEGSEPVDSDRLVNPMTWIILGSGAVDLRGPDHPQLWDPGPAGRAWAVERIRSDRPGGRWASGSSLLLRRTVSSLVLDTARLSILAGSGVVLSKVEAARAVAERVPGRFRRILEDSSGYRLGGRASMYWGPLERRGDALDLVRELAATAGDETPRPA